MLRRKSKGPEIYPCGTPCFITTQSENISWSKFVIFITIPIHITKVWFDPFINCAKFNLDSKVSWWIQNKAFDKTQKLSPTINLSVQGLTVSLINS